MNLSKIRRVAKLLTDDYHRQSNYLSFQDFTRIVASRQLSGSEADAVRSLLVDTGIPIDSPVERPRRPDEGGVTASRNTLGLFIRDMKRYRLLSHSEEIALGQAIAANREQLRRRSEPISADIAAAGSQARDEFILANLRLVFVVAKDYYGWSPLDLPDLIAEGCVGLMRAVEKYDHALGFKFSTYAVHWINQAISRSIANQGRVIRLPVHMYDEVQKLKKITNAIETEGHTADVSEIALQLGVDENRVIFLQQASQDVTSLDDVTSAEDDSHSALDGVPASREYSPDYELLQSDRRNAVRRACGRLDDRERSVIELRFGLGGQEEQTLEEIGSQLNVTRERIRQIEAKALKKLRHPAQARELETFTRS
ncbi:MAG TPA: RNA polymerase sigma factor RpoD/SigA [Thermoanaerobaculia bacterium]